MLGREAYNQWWISEGRRYYVKDHLGSVRVVLRDDGTVAETAATRESPRGVESSK